MQMMSGLDCQHILPGQVMSLDQVFGCKRVVRSGDDAQRHGALLLQRYDSLECRFVTRTAFRPTPGSPLYFIGTPFDYDRNEGYVGRTWQPATEDCP